MLTRKLIAIAAITLSCSAHAAIRFESQNTAGGVIALTDSVDSACPKGTLVAFSQGSTGQSIFGCWMFEPPNMIGVTWSNGEVRIYNAAGFTAVGK